MEIVDRRIAKIKSAITSISDTNFFVSLKKLASFTGQIIFMAPISGNISRVMTRHCVMLTFSAQHWDVELGFDQYCIKELSFWRANLDSFKVWDCFLSKKPEHFIYSDASATWCGLVIPVNEDHICHRLWEPSEYLKSLTWREMVVIDFALESFAPVLGGSAVKWYTDTHAAEKIIEVGSMKLDLHRLAIKIFHFCAKHNIRLEVQWIP